MPAVKPVKPVPSTTPPIEVVTQPEGYKGVTVDSEYIEVDTLTTYIEGKAWVGDLYTQILNDNNRPKDFDISIDDQYQPYRLIRGWELKVQTDQSVNQNSQSGELSATGSAGIYPIIVPNKGDIFIADAGDRQEGMWVFTDVKRNPSLYQKAGFVADYSLQGYMTAEIKACLDRRTQITEYFDLENLRLGYNPLLKGETLDLQRKVVDHWGRLIALYMKDFFSRENGTLVVPNQRTQTYDPFIVRFMLKTLGVDDHPYVRDMQPLNVSSDETMYEFTLWNVLEKMDYQLLPMVAELMTIIPIGWFRTRPKFNSVYYSTDVGAVIYPDQHPTNVDAGYNRQVGKVGINLIRGHARFEELDRLIQNKTLINDSATGPVRDDMVQAQSDIKRVTVDSFYVLSEAFYHYNPEVGGLSRLESIVMDAIKGKKIDLAVLERLCANAIHWDNVERFYYIPILLMLIRIYPRGL